MRNNIKNMLPQRRSLGGLAVSAFLLFLPGTVQAQAQPKQFFACYVPSSGVVYRIKEPGLKTACTGKKHVEFSWAELFAADDGKVGIGTSTPTAALDVVGDIHASGQLKLGNTMIFDGVANTITTGVNEDMAILPGGTGKVGIGTSSPGTKLHLANGGAGYSPSSASELAVESSGLTRIEVMSPASAAGSILFGSPTEADRGFITYDHSSDIMLLGSGGLTRMVIDDNGNVGIGNTAPGEALTVNGIVHSTFGGFKFPDGSIQTTAGGGGGGGGVSDHGLLSGLGDDDHLQYLRANGVRAAANGFAVTGNFGLGIIPIEGAGTRLMWYPGKAAFRAGAASPGTPWDAINIGQFSVAMGRTT